MLGSITSNLVTDAKNGGAAFVGGVVTRKVRGAVTGMLPASAQAQVSGAAGQVALSVFGAIVTSVAARKIAPSYARYVAAGAFSEAIACAVAQTPVAAYLGAYTPRRNLRIAGYPAAVPVRAIGAGGAGTRQVGVRAYPAPMRQVG